MLLSNVPNGALFKIKKVVLGREVGKRLADMGFTEGIEGRVVRSALFKGPLQIRLRDYDMLIRRFEASEIEVELIGDDSVCMNTEPSFIKKRMMKQMKPVPVCERKTR